MACILVETLDLDTILPIPPGIPEPPAYTCGLLQTLDLDTILPIPDGIPEADTVQCGLVATISFPPEDALNDHEPMVGGEGIIMVGGTGDTMVGGAL